MGYLWDEFFWPFLENLGKHYKWLGALWETIRNFVDRHRLEEVTYKKILPGVFFRGESHTEQELDEIFPELFDHEVFPNIPDIQIFAPYAKVRLTQPYFMAVQPVTAGEFQEFVAATGYQTQAESQQGTSFSLKRQGCWVSNTDISWNNTGFDQTENHPVVCVSWWDAVAYIRWLNSDPKKLKKWGKKWQFALPTEAQWERACRGKVEGTYFFWGDDPKEGVGKLNAADAALKWRYVFPFNDLFENTSPVDAGFAENGYGLYNMLGNTWEWCFDHFDAHYYANPESCKDPTGPLEEGFGTSCSRVIRGGSWASPPGMCRCACRYYLDNTDSRTDVGFRLVIVKKSDRLSGFLPRPKVAL